MAIEQNQVNAAADALAARKERVTIASVRDELGGGSFTTLSPWVKAWKEQHVAEAAAAEELPEEAQRAGEAAARSIWAAARADAAERIELIQAYASSWRAKSPGSSRPSRASKPSVRPTRRRARQSMPNALGQIGSRNGCNRSRKRSRP
jgi:transposase-like protein